MDYREEFYSARWHLDVAKRMLAVYDEYPEKRILVGVIREAAKAAGKLVRAFLIFDRTRGDLETFRKSVALRYMNSENLNNLINILEVERAQRKSRVEFAKKNKIILLDDGKWKILTASRLKEFVDSLGNILGNFPTDIKR